MVLLNNKKVNLAVIFFVLIFSLFIIHSSFVASQIDYSDWATYTNPDGSSAEYVGDSTNTLTTIPSSTNVPPSSSSSSTSDTSTPSPVSQDDLGIAEPIDWARGFTNVINSVKNAGTNAIEWVKKKVGVEPSAVEKQKTFEDKRAEALKEYESLKSKYLKQSNGLADLDDGKSFRTSNRLLPYKTGIIDKVLTDFVLKWKDSAFTSIELGQIEEGITGGEIRAMLGSKAVMDSISSTEVLSKSRIKAAKFAYLPIWNDVRYNEQDALKRGTDLKNFVETYFDAFTADQLVDIRGIGKINMVDKGSSVFKMLELNLAYAGEKAPNLFDRTFRDVAVLKYLVNRGDSSSSDSSNSGDYPTSKDKRLFWLYALIMTPFAYIFARGMCKSEKLDNWWAQILGFHIAITLIICLLLLGVLFLSVSGLTLRILLFLSTGPISFWWGSDNLGLRAVQSITAGIGFAFFLSWPKLIWNFFASVFSKEKRLRWKENRRIAAKKINDAAEQTKADQEWIDRIARNK